MSWQGAGGTPILVPSLFTHAPTLSFLNSLLLQQAPQNPQGAAQGGLAGPDRHAAAPPLQVTPASPCSHRGQQQPTTDLLTDTPLVVGLLVQENTADSSFRGCDAPRAGDVEVRGQLPLLLALVLLVCWCCCPAPTSHAAVV